MHDEISIGSTSASTSASIDTETISISSDSSDTRVEPISNGRKRGINVVKRRAISESDENDLIEKAFAAMNHQHDEFDIFGQYVASEMRQISNPSVRQIVKRDIMLVLLNSVDIMVAPAREMQQTIVQTNTQPSRNDCVSNQQETLFSCDRNDENYYEVIEQYDF